MGSHQRPAPPGSGRGRGATLTVLAAATAALGTVPAGAAPHAGGRAEVDRLYQEAEKATEAYNKADERAGTLRREVHRVQDRIARRQDEVNTLREELGSLAGAQYRSGGIGPALTLLLSADPDTYLERAAALDRIGARQTGRLGQLRSGLRELAQERAEATGKLAELAESREAADRHKRTVRRKLARARQVLDSLPSGERAAYDRALRSGRAPDPGLGLLSAPGGAVAPGARAAAAVAAARSALGRPYVWGANGPRGFDCSGLMQWAYAQAGVGLPRTSQEQRYAGRQVPLSQVRPGDLVVYRSDAGHVGMYVGDGQVIHAPYPGAPVRYDSVGMMPVSSVTRP